MPLTARVPDVEAQSCALDAGVRWQFQLCEVEPHQERVALLLGAAQRVVLRHVAESARRLGKVDQGVVDVSPSLKYDADARTTGRDAIGRCCC